jgi:hypothetical protein
MEAAFASPALCGIDKVGPVRRRRGGEGGRRREKENGNEGRMSKSESKRRRRKEIMTNAYLTSAIPCGSRLFFETFIDGLSAPSLKKATRKQP